MLEGSAAPVPVEDAPLVGAAATSVREKVAVTVTTWGVSPWPVGVEVTTVTEVKTWVDGGADEAVTTLVAMGAALLEGAGAALDGAALEGGGASDEGAAAEGELEAGAGLEGVFSGGLEDGAGAEEASVGAGAAEGVTDGEGRSDEGGSEDGAEAAGAGAEAEEGAASAV